MRKKLAAIAMAATGLYQPSIKLLGLELKGFFLFHEVKTCCHCCGCYRTLPTLHKTFGFGIKRVFYFMRRKLAATAMAATGLNQPSKRLLGLQSKVFYFLRKKLAAAAMAATGLK